VRSILAISAAIAALSIATPSSAATVVFGNPAPTSAGDCTPSCTPQFQTVYSRTQFGSAPVAITGITYFLRSLQTNLQNYTITLSTSANAVGSLSSTFANNVGADATTFYSGIPNSTSGGQDITFAGLFNYDPTLGDLLVDIAHSSSDAGLYSSYEGSESGLAQRVYSFDASGNGVVSSPTYAIATRFTTGEVVAGAVPEPATWALMLLGFGFVGGAMRTTKRRQFATVSYA
jgi:PEP-CTERM motif